MKFVTKSDHIISLETVTRSYICCIWFCAEHVVDRIYGFPAMVIIAIASCLIGATGVAIFLYLNPRKSKRYVFLLY